jgi:5'-3' exonuclease
VSIALVDGDVLCYRIGFACQHEDVSFAIQTLTTYLEDILFKTLQVGACEVFLTGKGNFRNEVAVTAPYKGNRKKAKPTHLPALRQHLGDLWAARVSEGEEADDLIAIRATELGDSCVIVSVDKDFNQVAGWHYNFVKQNKYYVSEEEGLRFFYKQILMGDNIDNVVGIKGVGEKRAEKMLAKSTTEQEMYAVCLAALGEERTKENGQLLWLRRQINQVWCAPLSTLPATSGG